jgi:hypothetical protein
MLSEHRKYITWVFYLYVIAKSYQPRTRTKVLSDTQLLILAMLVSRREAIAQNNIGIASSLLGIPR